jgi:hypothetical protein
MSGHSSFFPVVLVTANKRNLEEKAHRTIRRVLPIEKVITY